MVTTKHPLTATYIGAHGAPVTREAFIALRAAAMRASVGTWAARQYFLAHSGARTLRLYRIACQLHALNHWNSWQHVSH